MMRAGLPTRLLVSPRSNDDTFPPSLVTVIDTSALIELSAIGEARLSA